MTAACTSSARWRRRMTGARAELGEHAPRIETIKIPTDKIREVIGSGGSVIREIVAESGAKIDIEDDGTVKIASANRESIEKALARIRGITSEPEVGTIYKGKVVKIMEFGAFVNFFGAKDGLVHISQLTQRPPRDGRRSRQGRPGSLRQAAGLRRSRQDAPVDEDRRSDDRPGNPARRRRARRSVREPSAAPRRWPWRRASRSAPLIAGLPSNQKKAAGAIRRLFLLRSGGARPSHKCALRVPESCRRRAHYRSLLAGGEPAFSRTIRARLSVRRSALRMPTRFRASRPSTPWRASKAGYIRRRIRPRAWSISAASPVVSSCTPAECPAGCRV